MFEVNRQALLAAISAAMPAVATRSTTPILNSFLLEADADQLTLTASNLEQRISITITAKVEQPLAIALPAKLLDEWSKAARGDVVTCKLQPNRTSVKLTSGKINTTLHCFDGVDFPTSEATATAHCEFSVPARELHYIINLTRTGASEIANSGAVYNHGINIDVTPTALRAVATDGYHLAEYQTPLLDAAEYLDIVIPIRALPALLNMLNAASAEALADVSIFDNNIAIVVSGSNWLRGTIQLQRLQGLFPKTVRNLVVKNLAIATLSRSELVAAFNSALIVARQNDNRVELTIGNNTLYVKALAAELGLHEDALDAKTTGNLSLIVNGEYVMDWLGKVKCNDVLLGGSENRRPLWFYAAEEVERGRFMVMPMVDKKVGQ